MSLTPEQRQRIQRAEKRLRRVENTAVSLRKGVIADDSPLTVTIGETPIAVTALDNTVYAVGDVVYVQMFGGKAVIQGRPTDSTALAAPSFATGWSNFGAPWKTAGYYRSNGRVYLQGAVKNGGTGTGTIFTLPTGYRPSAQVAFPVSIYAATGTVTVDSAGVVTDGTFSGASKTITSLAPISFRISD